MGEDLKEALLFESQLHSSGSQAPLGVQGMVCPNLYEQQTCLTAGLNSIPGEIIEFCVSNESAIHLQCQI